jgi:hypothetical protein
LIREWQRVNTPEGRARLIDNLWELQESIDSLIDQFETNKELNGETVYMSLTLNQQHIKYLMLRAMEIDQIRHLWRQI